MFPSVDCYTTSQYKHQVQDPFKIMQVLQSYRVILKLLGIFAPDKHENSKKFLVSQYVCLVAPILILFPLIAFFVVNFRNVAQATSALYLICIIVMTLLNYVDCLIKKSTIQSIVVRLGRIVDDSSTDFQRFYHTTEKHSNEVVEYLNLFMFGTIFFVLNIPLVVVVVVWLTGNYSDDIRRFPAALLYV